MWPTQQSHCMFDEYLFFVCVFTRPRACWPKSANPPPTAILRHQMWKPNIVWGRARLTTTYPLVDTSAKQHSITTSYSVRRFRGFFFLIEVWRRLRPLMCSPLGNSFFIPLFLPHFSYKLTEAVKSASVSPTSAFTRGVYILQYCFYDWFIHTTIFKLFSNG